jgi:hypothetical protein
MADAAESPKRQRCGIPATMERAVMPVTSDLIGRCVELKGELLEYALRPRFAKSYRKGMDRYFGERDWVDDVELANFLDWFALQQRPPGDRTIVEHFVTEHPQLTEEERGLLLGWRDVVESIFEVRQRAGDAILVVSLVDELTYRVYSNLGPGAFRAVRPGSFVFARLVPLGEAWLLSGISTILPPASSADAYRIALDIASRWPELVFRNPELLAEAWAQQREEHRHFVKFFGTDQLVLPGRELAERMQAFDRFRMYEVRDVQARTAAERAKEAYGAAPPPPDHSFPPELLTAETVGVIMDEVEGLNYFINFGRLQEIFADPSRASHREHRQAVQKYLKDPSVSPLAFRRLAEPDPDKASQVFKRVLKQPNFSWERDGETLLRRHKARFFKQEPLPSVTVVGERLAMALLAAGEKRESRSQGPRWRRWGSRET